MLQSSYCHRPIQEHCLPRRENTVAFIFIVSSSTPTGVDEEVRTARCIWSTTNGLPYPPDVSAVRQRCYDAPGVAGEWNTIWKGSLSELDQSRSFARKAPYSSDWLFVLPIPLVISTNPTMLPVLLSDYFSVLIYVSIIPVRVVRTFARGVHTVFRGRTAAVCQHAITKSMTSYGEHCGELISMPLRNSRVF